MTVYRDVDLHIGGQWRGASDGGTLPVLNPATGEVLGSVAAATQADLEAAAEAAARGFEAWRAVSPYERSKVLRKAASGCRARGEAEARTLRREQGRPLAEAQAGLANAADLIEWFAEEGRRADGRLIPGRAANVQQAVLREPVGPVVAFTPWNFPISQSVRNLSAAVCTGCSVVFNGPEQTPYSCV